MESPLDSIDGTQSEPDGNTRPEPDCITWVGLPHMHIPNDRTTCCRLLLAHHNRIQAHIGFKFRYRSCVYAHRSRFLAIIATHTHTHPHTVSACVCGPADSGCVVFADVPGAGGPEPGLGKTELGNLDRQMVDSPSKRLDSASHQKTLQERPACSLRSHSFPARGRGAAASAGGADLRADTMDRLRRLAKWSALDGWQRRQPSQFSTHIHRRFFVVLSV